MDEQRFDDEGSELRPERLGGALSLRPERLGHESGDRSSPREGWMLNPEGTTAGRLFQFRSVAEMHEFVAGLEGLVDTLLARRPKSPDGSVTLLVFLAAHRMLGARESGDEP